MSMETNDSVCISLDPSLNLDYPFTDLTLINSSFSTLPSSSEGVNISHSAASTNHTPCSEKVKPPLSLDELIETDQRDFLNISDGKRRRTTTAALLKAAFPAAIEKKPMNDGNMQNKSLGKGKEKEPSGTSLKNTEKCSSQSSTTDANQMQDGERVRFLTREEDRAEIDQGIQERLLSLRKQERELMASLYRAKIENQILLNSRSLIDQRIRDIQHRQVLSRSKEIEKSASHKNVLSKGRKGN